VFVIDLPDYLDADNDSMDDRWETLFGVTDPAADPDGDGRTTRRRKTPAPIRTGRCRRFLAEGATGAFFHTAIALANPGPDRRRGADLRSRGRHADPASDRDTGRPFGGDRRRCGDRLETADVSATIESDGVLGIQRSMTWGASPPRSTVRTPRPRRRHRRRRGFWPKDRRCSISIFFYLLQNPQATPNTPPSASCSVRDDDHAHLRPGRQAAARPST
jgi:hypothetical protein